MFSTRAAAIPSLTGIRGVAAMWVMTYHVTIKTAGRLLQVPAISDFPLFNRGYTGVDLFFALSGFILMYSHGSEFVSLAPRVITRFVKLRFLRVYPLNWAVLGLICALCLLDAQFWKALKVWSAGDNPIIAFLRTALLGTRWLPGDGDWNAPTWSLSAEIVGYAAFPALAWLLVRINGFWTHCAIAITAVATLLAYQIITHSVGFNDFVFGSLPRMGCSFIAGAALARAHLFAPSWLIRSVGALSMIVLGLILVSIFSWRGSALLPAEFATLIFLLSFQKGLIDRILRTRPLLFLGRISFSLYLIHMQILVFIEIHLLPLAVGSRVIGSALLVGYFVITLPLAWLLNVTIERPSQRLGRYVVGTRKASVSGSRKASSSGNPES